MIFGEDNLYAEPVFGKSTLYLKLSELDMGSPGSVLQVECSGKDILNRRRTPNGNRPVRFSVIIEGQILLIEQGTRGQPYAATVMGPSSIPGCRSTIPVDPGSATSFTDCYIKVSPQVIDRL